jgi:signal recognition particle receptor subunit beta
MPTLHPSKQLLRVKIVYYGAGQSGKTTNLKMLHQVFPAGSRGAMVTLDTESERTLFFDYFPAHLGNLRGYKVQVDFFSVPGQSFYNSTRRELLRNVDGVVFVADSSERRENANLLALENLEHNLTLYGRSLKDTPHVLQWNKRDVADAVPVNVMEALYNHHAAPSESAIASEMVGVWETQTAVLRTVLERLSLQYGQQPAAMAG